MNFLINTDGASRGNPGPASYGYIIKNSDNGLIIHEEGKTLGINTNNFAEYNGVLNALLYIERNFSAKTPHKIEVKADSKLAVEQLSGRYKVKNQILKNIFDEIKSLEISLGQVYYTHVPREQNFIADKLANKALDGR